MPTAHILYSNQLRTSATHLKSGQTLITDAPTDNHGRGEAFSPTDLVATALASCMLTIMGIVAGKHNLPFEEAHVSMTKVMASGPRRISKVELTIQMPKHPFTDQEKELLEQAALNCPVAKSLHPDLEQVVAFTY